MKIKVLVVDDNKEYTNAVMKYFNGSKEIEVIAVANNGDEAIKLIEDPESNFDMILLDLVMPVKDGFYVLDYLKDKNIKQNIIVSTSYAEDETIKTISEYGVKYYALKPYDMENLEKRIINIVNSERNKNTLLEIEGKDLQIQVTRILHALGIPSHIKGYQYIRSAILMVYDNPGYIGSITKELYPGLSVKFNTSIQRVERAIRHAIEVSWLRGDIDLMEEIFGHSVDIDRAKPTNSEFIVTIADKLRLDMIDIN